MTKILALVLLLTAMHGYSQFSFPGLSPKGHLEQRVGYTDITVTYERPAARGRKVFGDLVQYGKLWRTGAGNCTKISFSNPVMIGDKKINAGTYSLFTIPGKQEWTVILNADTSLYGLSAYDAQKDIIRFKASARKTDRYFESLSIDIDVQPNNAVFYIAWEQTQISFLVDTEADQMVRDFIRQDLLTGKSYDPEHYAMAAEFNYYGNRDLDQAIILIDKAIAMKNEAWYYRQKIDILEKQQKYADAIACARLAIAVNQKRADWDQLAKQQSETEYQQRIEYFKSKLKLIR